MEHLPGELLIEICSHLPHDDLLSLSYTCSSFAVAAKPFLFETLTFNGDKQPSKQHILLRSLRDRKYEGTFKPVELAYMEASIDEVIDLNILKHVTTFQYSPKLYMDDFWLQYHQWVEDRADIDTIHADVDPEHMDESMSDAWDSDEEWEYVGVRREAELRQARPAKEEESIMKAELYWNAKIVEQQQAGAANHAALVRLFQHMPSLDQLRIMEWSCAEELKRHGIDGAIDLEVESQFLDYEILNWHLVTLSVALGEAGIRPKQLFLPTVHGRSITRTPVVQQLFSALTSLSFSLHDPAEMLGGYDESPPSLRTLIRCSRHTLEKLEFSNLFAHSPEHPRRGEHLLEKLWDHDSDDESTTIKFPRLRELALVSFILYAPSLIDFLKAQVTLERVTFRHTYLPTQGYGWPDVAAALPPSCHALHISHCGGKSTSRVYPDPAPDSNVTHSKIKPLRPYTHQFPESCGWRVSKSYLQRETKKCIAEYWEPMRRRIADRIASAHSDGDGYTGAPISELLEQQLELEEKVASKTREFRKRVQSQNSADYERM